MGQSKSGAAGTLAGVVLVTCLIITFIMRTVKLGLVLFT